MKPVPCLSVIFPRAAINPAPIGVVGSLLIALAPNGCAPCALFTRTLAVQGVIVDSESEIGVANVSVGGSLFTDNEETSYRDPRGATSSRDLLPTNDAGEFRIIFFAPDFGETCGLPPFNRTIRDPIFPEPNRIELIVIRDGCETTHVIEVNEDTVVDLSFPNDTLELKDPILVPPCEENADAKR